MIAVIHKDCPATVKTALEALGFSVLALPPHPSLPSPVANHPDMLLFFSHNAILTTKEYARVAKKELGVLSAHCKKEIRVTQKSLRGIYPYDILLNAAPVGYRLFCLARNTAEEILESTMQKICPVKQGYAKCSVLPLGENALITEDPSIASVARKEGLDVLQISQNAVSLPGYESGFLGGAASFSPYERISTVLFCGNLDLHPDSVRIKEFCQKHGYHPKSLSHEPLIDIGTVFLV